ncbi:ABC transporter ATP-binding protein [Croceicoccus sp. BE223]|uniref:ABC transporter ATP-binding protein n=1 Tax=Croceicoccus sp. BE223 TaxID=2817716 RepID=UPI00285D8D0B|nr:ABC transporter ATP-binding protein [Croceicoccus sp. BE223]MDR7103526.1 iron complex transport system ATP-binding protein [Croceicoccus sp. BE223]
MIVARDLTVRRGGRDVVRDAGFALRPGELTAICGPNGAGKSSLLAALAALLPFEGEALLAERPIAAIPARERARAIGFLPQRAEAAWDVSVRTLVELGRLPWRSVPGRLARASREADRAAVDAALAAMELADLADRPVSNLSGGERARAFMARVLAGEPDWILADEPLASLDLAHQQRLAACLADQARRGRGVVVVMHDLAAAMNHADRVLVLDRGRVVGDGAPLSTLTEALIGRVWQVEAHWLGEPGRRALAFGQGA